MAANTVKVTLQIRHDTAENWTTRNPVLAQGEFALETDTYLMKIGDGVRTWINLPYLNKLNATYFKQNNDGTLTFSDSFLNKIAALEAAAGEAITSLEIINDPVQPTDAVNLRYLQQAISEAGHLKRQVVETLPNVEDADENILYMMWQTDHYEEYMVINGIWDMVGTTGDSTAEYELLVATNARLGGVKASTSADQINVTQEGFMTLNQVSTSLLYVPTGDTLVIYGGTA